MTVGRGEDAGQVRFRAACMLEERFGIEHSTLQVEHELDQDELLEIETGGGAKSQP